LIKAAIIRESALPRPGSIVIQFDIAEGEKVPLDFKLFLEELTGQHHLASERSFGISSTLFLSRIDDFKTLRRRHGNFALTYDDFFQQLVSTHSHSISQLNLAKEDVELRIKPNKVREGLKSGGFLRWNTQSEDQLRDIGRLALLPNGANFSVPGSGKTNALLAVHCLLKQSHPGTKLLVACPKNAMLAWDEEVEECFGSSETVVRLQGTKSSIARSLSTSPSIAVISYQLLKSALPELIAYMRRSKVHLVLDESHRIKAGGKSQQGAAALELAHFAVRRDILSGTPMPQGFSDLTAQFKFLWPNLDLFRRITPDQSPEEQIKQANSDIKPFFVRTTKRELGLDKPKIRNIDVQMSPNQADVYRLLKDESVRYLARLDPRDKEELRSIGKQIMRVMQFCSEPNLLLERLPKNSLSGELGQRLQLLSSETTSKTLELDRLVKQTMSRPGEKVVIWSMFVNQIEHLAKRYEEFGSTTIHGGIPTGPDDDMEFREARIQMFKKDPGCRVLVANPSACGEGISLHKAAHHAIYFDRSFNAAHFLQSIDRIHRRGLEPGIITKVDILCLAETIEESVRSRLSEKIRLLQKLLDDDDLSAMVFDPEDLEEMGQDDFVSPSDLESVLESLRS
jgi:SNF2 family DNA or RNA helicase